MRRRTKGEEGMLFLDCSQSWLAYRAGCASNKRMKTVERWGNDRFVRMVNSQRPRYSVKLANFRSQLMRKVVMTPTAARSQKGM